MPPGLFVCLTHLSYATRHCVRQLSTLAPALIAVDEKANIAAIAKITAAKK
jgi:hypothetical protein